MHSYIPMHVRLSFILIKEHLYDASKWFWHYTICEDWATYAWEIIYNIQYMYVCMYIYTCIICKYTYVPWIRIHYALTNVWNIKYVPICTNYNSFYTNFGFCQINNDGFECCVFAQS